MDCLFSILLVCSALGAQFHLSANNKWVFAVEKNFQNFRANEANHFWTLTKNVKITLRGCCENNVLLQQYLVTRMGKPCRTI